MKQMNLLMVGFLLTLTSQLLASVPSLNDCPDMIFIDGLQNDSLPSGGSGGMFPGASTRTIFVNSSLGVRTYYAYVPTTYQPSEPLPLMFLWHGAGGPGTAPAAAQSVRDLWESTAEEQRFIIVAQEATGTTGGGFIPANAENVLLAILADMEDNYNIELNRIYGWGFSSGGHVMHDKALERTDIFAAYAVNAGILAAAATVVAPLNADRELPVYVSVGSSDSLLSFAQNDRLNFINAGWVEGKNYWLDVFAGGHVLPNDAPGKAWDKICISTVLD